MPHARGATRRPASLAAAPRSRIPAAAGALARPAATSRPDARSQFVALDLSREGVAVHAEDARSLDDVASGGGEHFDDVPRLYFLQRQCSAGSRIFCGSRAPLLGQVLDAQRISLGDQHRAFDDVAQLANVTLPIVSAQKRQRLIRDRRGMLAI